jgi:hypothetical protein
MNRLSGSVAAGADILLVHLLIGDVVTVGAPSRHRVNAPLPWCRRAGYGEPTRQSFMPVSGTIVVVGEPLGSIPCQSRPQARFIKEVRAQTQLGIEIAPARALRHLIGQRLTDGLADQSVVRSGWRCWWQ